MLPLELEVHCIVREWRIRSGVRVHFVSEEVQGDKSMARGFIGRTTTFASRAHASIKIRQKLVPNASAVLEGRARARSTD